MYLPEVESVMHRYVWCMPEIDQQNDKATTKHGYLSVSDTVMMMTVALKTDKLGIRFQHCIYLCKWNLTIAYWVLEGYHLAYVQIIDKFRNFWITITSILYIFFGIGLTLTHTRYTLYQYHKTSAAIFHLTLCSMNMDTKMVLVFLMTWIL